MKNRNVSGIVLAVSAGLAIASSASAQVIYNNGPLSTGATSGSLVAAPAGFTWSECPDDGTLLCANTSAGFSCGIVTPATTEFRMADNFTIPAGQTWNITGVSVYAYQTGSIANPFSGCSLNIWNGAPGVVGSTVVFGDNTTNRMSATSNTTIYRVFNTTSPAPGTVPGTTRLVRQLDLTAVVSLGPGTYWIDTQTSLTVPAAHFMPVTSANDNRQIGGPGSNCKQYQSAIAAWVDGIDTGNPATCSDLTQDIPFLIRGTIVTAPSCYADCDGIGGLTGNDFQCFLNAFVANLAYADCDGIGGLTGNDFQCFLNKFVAGCS